MIDQQRTAPWGYILFLCLLGAYLNAVAYGFEYPKGADYNFLLPLLNWLREPALYASDPIREAFVRHESVFWPIVAKLSSHFSTQHVLFGFFILTKLIFFLAVGRLVASEVRNKLLGAVVVAAIAVSPFLNSSMPLGAAEVLGKTSEHGLLGIAMLLLAGAFLVEGKWCTAAIVASVTVYIDALVFLHTLPAFGVLAVAYWKREKRRIFVAGLVGSALLVPWVIHFYASLAVTFPADYVHALTMYFPLHSTLRWTPTSDVLKAVAILLALGWIGFIVTSSGLTRNRRLEVLAMSYLIPLLVGVLFDAIYLTPSIARICLLRADSFLMPYSILLIQMYGAIVLSSPVARYPKTSLLLGIFSVLLPLSIHLVAPLLFVLLLLRTDPKARFELLCQRLFNLVRGLLPRVRIPQPAALFCSLCVLASFVTSIAEPQQLWNFLRPAQPDESACYDAQFWARAHTPSGARFLVPPVGCGFRVLSERSSWGEWTDGTAIWFDPSFADTFLERAAAMGLHPDARWYGANLAFLEENYRRQSWDHLRAIATQARLDYVVQFRNVHYPVTPAFENERYAIYLVSR